MKKPIIFHMLKPDAFELNLSDKILNRLAREGDILDQQLIERPPSNKVWAHLASVVEEHGEQVAARNTAFYEQGPLLVFVLQSNKEEQPAEFVKRIRKLVGATDPSKAAKGTIRKWAKDNLEAAIAENRGLRNLIHASDSPEAAMREIQVWLPDFVPSRLSK